MEQTPKYNKRSKLWAVVIGIGLALSPIHNLWLTKLATLENGETVFFLPAFGYIALIMGTGLFLLNHWHEIKANGLGDKRIYIPLLIIVVAIGLSGVTVSDIERGLAPFFAGVSFFALYLVARILGKDLFLPLAIGAVIASLGIIAYQFWNPGLATGGFVFERNYDVATGYILLGVALFINRWQWLFAMLAVIALFLSGSAEFIFAIIFIVIMILWRKDWSKKLGIIAAGLLVVAVLFFGLGYGQSVHKLTAWATTGDSSFIPERRYTDRGTVFERRGLSIKNAMTNIKPFGEGYNLTEFNKLRIVHDVPLVIVQQLGYPGILAGLAWLFVSLYCLIKTKWKYSWALVLSLSVFDHYIWTQLAPYWWAIIGVSTAGGIKNDLVFKGIK